MVRWNIKWWRRYHRKPHVDCSSIHTYDTPYASITSSCVSFFTSLLQVFVLFWFFLNHSTLEIHAWVSIMTTYVTDSRIFPQHLWPRIGSQMNNNSTLVITFRQSHTIRIDQSAVSFQLEKIRQKPGPIIHIPHMWVVSTWVQSCVSQALISIEVFVCIYSILSMLHTEMVMVMKFIQTFISKRWKNTRLVNVNGLWSIQRLATLCLFPPPIDTYASFIFIWHIIEYDRRNTTIRLYRHWIEIFNENIGLYCCEYSVFNIPSMKVYCVVCTQYSTVHAYANRKQKKKRVGKPKTENYDTIVFKFMLHCICLSADENGLILNVATIEFSISFNYLDLNFNACQNYALF